MKKVLMICALLFSVITFANAQDGERKMQTPEERAERTATQLTKKLSLNEDQKAKVKTIFLDQANTMMKMREESKGDREGMMAKMKAINDANDVKINAILNDDQKKAFAEWQEERKEMMKKRMEARGQAKPKG